MSYETTLKKMTEWIVEGIEIAREFERIAADQFLVESLPSDRWGEKIGRTLANAIAYRTVQQRLERHINDIKNSS